MDLGGDLLQPAAKPWQKLTGTADVHFDPEAFSHRQDDVVKAIVLVVSGCDG